MLAVLRWVLMASAILNALLATVLFRSVGAPLMSAWTRRFARPDSGAPGWLRDPRALRLWALVSSLATLALWWWLGTRAGATAIEELVR